MSVGSISMIVTSLPKCAKIDANSQPMMPPPSTTSRRGTSVWESRPVESTQRGESSPGIGGRIGYEPVATMALLKVTSSAPSTAIVVGLVNRPVPLTHSTPFAFSRLATPPVICLTTPSFQAAACAKSSCGSDTPTPSFANVSRASCSACAVCTHALVGIHPTRRHVPPTSGSCSMHTTLPPSWAARIAAVYPAGPPPRTATSHSIPVQPFVDSGTRRSYSRELGSQRQGVVRLVDLVEAVLLVERDRALVVTVDAEADVARSLPSWPARAASRSARSRPPCRVRSGRPRSPAPACARRRSRTRASLP